MLERVGDVLLGRRLAREERGQGEGDGEPANHFSRW
jgi:hypothetical protein